MFVRLIPRDHCRGREVRVCEPECTLDLVYSEDYLEYGIYYNDNLKLSFIKICLISLSFKTLKLQNFIP